MAYRSFTLTIPKGKTRSSAVCLDGSAWGKAQLLLPAVAATPTLGMQTHTDWSENHPDMDLVNDPSSDTGWAIVETVLGVPLVCATVDATSATAVMLNTSVQQGTNEATSVPLPIGWFRLTASVTPSAAADYAATLIIND